MYPIDPEPETPDLPSPPNPRLSVRWLPVAIIVILVAGIVTLLVLMTSSVDRRLDAFNASLDDVIAAVDTTSTSTTSSTTTTPSTSTTSTTVAEAPPLYFLGDTATVNDLEFTLDYVIYPSPSDFLEAFNDSGNQIRQVAWANGEQVHLNGSELVSLPDGISYVDDDTFSDYLRVWGTYRVTGSQSLDIFDHQFRARTPTGAPLSRAEEFLYGGAVLPNSPLQSYGSFVIPYPMDTITLNIPMGTTMENPELLTTIFRTLQINMLDPAEEEES